MRPESVRNREPLGDAGSRKSISRPPLTTIQLPDFWGSRANWTTKKSRQAPGFQSGHHCTWILGVRRPRLHASVGSAGPLSESAARGFAKVRAKACKSGQQVREMGKASRSLVGKGMHNSVTRHAHCTYGTLSGIKCHQGPSGLWALKLSGAWKRHNQRTWPLNLSANVLSPF